MKVRFAQGLAAAFFLVLAPSHLAWAGWERVSASEIRLAGLIGRDSYDEYLQIAGEGYSTLRLQSAGGFPLVALMIAEDVANRNVDIVVDGYCMSACANYLALAGKSLTVPCDSLLAWHGTPSSGLGRVQSEMRAQQLPEALISAYVNWLTAFKRREQIFYDRVGVDYQLLQDSVEIVHAANITPEVTFQLDELTGEYTVSTITAPWIPRADVLERYGVNFSKICDSMTDEHIRALLDGFGVTAPFTSKSRDEVGLPKAESGGCGAPGDP